MIIIERLLLFFIPELLGICMDWFFGKPSLGEMNTILSKFNNLCFLKHLWLRQALKLILRPYSEFHVLEFIQ